MTLPFFDQPVDVTIGINLDGSFSVKLGAANGLYTLTKPDILTITLDSLAFELKDRLFIAKLSGKVQPLIAGLDWPGFQVNELAIDSEGNVHLDGGWLNLKDQYALDFHGFKLEITKLGFGKTEDGGKWIGFNGGLKLVDGLPAGATVEGLKVTWYDDGRDTDITLGGVGVEFKVPGVLEFKGYVAYKKVSEGGRTVHRFDGDIRSARAAGRSTGSTATSSSSW